MISGDVIVDDPMLLQGLPRQRPLEIMEYLEGTWVGEGIGEYPPHLPRFPFVQELFIEKAVPHSTKELHWSFRSVCRHRETKEGLSSESGFLRFFPEALDHGKLEMVCTASNGLAEINEGTYSQDSFDVWTRYNGLTRPAKASQPFAGVGQVTEVRRSCQIWPSNVPMSLEYRVEMATERSAMQPHLVSRLRKKDI
eukprot:CAMPEP_0197632792 /NCGR_PEP_ID=MMETSP1338-20131121/9370_1 /TAXON_ID=43686 ORGANISM="Pelagodinium beii, Strain RCC1491" /NCGR_SAMPLE_ID=MMETSP1338 /ASSEMBLY_ACC=CAM_ASM_000754 /LENGTH=195 /DNA_ID=CAMNT_0043204363 /DNA_START=73 /DNA_END=660 /DNA_ORIENTATION=+